MLSEDGVGLGKSEAHFIGEDNVAICSGTDFHGQVRRARPGDPQA